MDEAKQDDQAQEDTLSNGTVSTVQEGAAEKSGTEEAVSNEPAAEGVPTETLTSTVEETVEVAVEVKEEATSKPIEIILPNEDVPLEADTSVIDAAISEAFKEEEAEQVKQAKLDQEADKIIELKEESDAVESKAAEEPVIEDSSEDDEEEEEQEEIIPEIEGMDWYIVNAYSGYESKAKTALQERIRNHEMERSYGTILVPQETVIEMVRGQKRTTSRKFYPGYMLVQMVMNQDTWHLVKETPKISGFVGDASNPEPMSSDEVERILKQVADGASSPRARMSFDHGDSIKVVDGPFADFNGTVEEVRPEKGKLKVLISIFGRATPVELDFAQVEKL